MLIFELLDQYEGICRRAFFGCATKLNKTFIANIIEILILIMCIPRKINFLQLDVTDDVVNSDTVRLSVRISTGCALT